MSKTITRQIAKEIGDKIKAFTDSLEAEYGIEVVKRSVSYTDLECNVTIKTRIKEDERGEGVLTHEEALYDANIGKFSLPPRGTLIRNGFGEEFVIDAWIPKGRKFKISGTKCDNGKKYKFEVRQIQSIEIVRLGSI